MPAFQISIPAPWYTAEEIQKTIIQPLERSLKEIENIDTTQSVAMANYATTMIMFEVGTNKETAYTRLINKLESNKNKSPLGIQNYQIISFDPDDIPVYTFAVNYNTSSTWSTTAINKSREIALDIVEKIKNITEVGAISLIWWEANDITIEIDPESIETQWVDIMQVYQTINKNNVRSPGGKYRSEWTLHTLTIDGTIQKLEDIENLMVTNINETPIYIKDIATVRYGKVDKKDATLFTNTWGIFTEPVFVWIAKKKWTNAVHVVEKIEKELDIIRQQLPEWYSLQAIQNEWETAATATSRLLHELFSSVLVLFIVMFLFMGWKDAFSSSTSIPLVLGITFWISLLLWDNINRITLFALILVLWMLVDDSIIVVENISRHLKNRDKNKETLLPLILKATGEIWWAALFSTITKIVAFLWMFFVSGMMWQYMSPIPKYAIIALSVSLIVAFSVNPFLSYVFAIAENKKNHSNQTNPSWWWRTRIYTQYKKKLDIWLLEVVNNNILLRKIYKSYTLKKILTRKENTSINESINEEQNTEIDIIKKQQNPSNFMKRYENIIRWFLENTKNGATKRKWIKKWFRWFLIALLLILPTIWVFRRRMLPKSNVNQIYLWIDTPIDSSITYTNSVAYAIDTWLHTYKIQTWQDQQQFTKEQKELQLIKNISYWIWVAPTPDFSNSFRWSAMRQSENTISMRINLLEKEKRDITSEAFVMLLRDDLQRRLENTYPWVSIRLLEDPPGPPVKATWMIKVQSDTTTPKAFIDTTASRLYQKLQDDIFTYDIVDHDISIDRQPQNIEIKIDHEAIARAWLGVEQVSQTLYSLFEGMAINTYYAPDTKEPLAIYIKVKDLYTDYESVSFMNPKWEKIPLNTIAQINATNTNQIHYFDEWQPTTYIYGEMWNNSVIYPMISFLTKATSDDFWEWRFHVEDRSMYWITLRENWTNIPYMVSFGWEWELSMDTFRDLWLALGLTLFALYIIVSVRFKWFGMWGIIMLPFLFGFIGILPWYSLLYFTSNEYFTATSMIWVIALAWISIWNSIIFLEYFEELQHQWLWLEESLVMAWITRLKPIFLTSATAIIGALMIIGDPVWSWLAWSIIWWLSSSAILTLLLIPIFVYDNRIASIEKTAH